MKYKTRKRIGRIVAIVLLAALILPQNRTTSYAGSNSNLTNDYIKQKEEEIKRIQQEKQTMQQGISDAKALLKQLQAQKEDLFLYAAQVDALLLELEEKIETLNGQITVKEQEIEDTKAELAEAQELERQQYEAMKVRIRFMYEEGDSYYLEMLFSSTGFADMLNKADYIEAITEYDRRKLEEYIMNEQLIAACQAELEAQQEALQAQKEGLQSEQETQEAIREQAQRDIAAKQASIDEENATLEQWTAELEAQTAVMQALEAQIEAERKRLEELNKPVQTYDGGTFIWPCPSSKRVTSPFGWRIHPVYHDNRFHNGIDIGAKSGSDILAAYNGTVVAAAWNASMGNYIMINHGDGLYTIYMHCSKFYISQGQYVTRGQVIAAVGSTGMSTGPHLHFGVRLNGTYQDPLSYVR